ncbi:hypothetical protein GW17_00045473, partial [Ensete ventricosum]
LLSRFGPSEYKNINGQLAKIRQTSTVQEKEKEKKGPRTFPLLPPLFLSSASAASAAAPSPLLLPSASAATVAASSVAVFLSSLICRWPPLTVAAASNRPSSLMPTTTASASPSPPTIASPLPSPSVASSSVGHHSSSPLLHHRQPSLPSPTTAASFSQPPAALGRTHPHRHHLFLAFPFFPAPHLPPLPPVVGRCLPFFPAASSTLLLPPTPSSSPSVLSSTTSASCYRSASVPLSLLPPPPCCRSRLQPCPPHLLPFAATSATATPHRTLLLVELPLLLPRRTPLLVGTCCPSPTLQTHPLTQQQKKELNITDLQSYMMTTYDTLDARFKAFEALVPEQI